MDTTEAGPNLNSNQTTNRTMADAARADFLKAKAKEASQKGKTAKKKGKGKAEATAGADEKPKDWVELDTETYELLEKANEGRDEMLIPNWNRIKNEKVKTTTTILGKPPTIN